MKMKKLASILLVLTLVIATLSACGSASVTPSATPAANVEATKAPASTEASTAAPSVETTAAPATAESLKQVTLTWLPIGWGDNPTGVLKTPITDEVARLTGVTVDVINSGAAGDITAKLTALMATNDLPDIVSIPNGDVLKGMYDAQLLLPLDDLMEKFGPNLKTNLATANVATKASYADGKLYRFPADVGLFGYDTLQPTVAPFLRWDLYKALGAPEVKNLEEFIPIVQKMLEKEPTNAAGQKNYGLAPWFGGAAWDGDWNIWGGPACVFGINCNNYSSMNNLNDFIYTPKMLIPDSDYYKVLHFWFAANQAKILDPDSFIMKGEQATEKFKAGRIMMTFASWNAGDANTAFTQAGLKEKGMTAVKLPADCTSIWLSSDQPAGTPGSGYGISVKSKEPEAAIKFLDFLNSYDGVELVMSGIKGTHWDMVDGIPAMKDDVIKKSQSDTAYGKSQGFGFFGPLSSIAKGVSDPRYPGKMVYVNFWSMPNVNKTKMTDIQKDMVAYYKIETPIDLILKNPNIKNYVMKSPEWPYMDIVPDDMQTIFNQVDAYALNNYAPMILAKNEADFTSKRDAYMKGLKDVGYEKAVQWYIDAQQRAIAKIPK